MTETQPLPDVPMYRAMRKGHKIRKGHDLVAHLATDDGGETFRIVKECCADGNA